MEEPAGAADGLRFFILGPLRVEALPGEVQIGGVRRRNVLVRLLASPNEVVPLGLLAEDVWEGEPPPAAASTLQSHVSALRQLLGTARLVFVGGGYRIRVDAGELDSALFDEDVAGGRAALARGDHASAIEALDRATTRWRGSPFADAQGAAWVAGRAARLEETRNSALEDALDARLALGMHHEVCALAEAAVADQPYRERRWGTLMLALYRSGRQADALRCYERVRDRLAEELGIDPSQSLVDLERDILSQSPALEYRGEAHRVIRLPPDPTAAPGGLNNLPNPVASFVGRAAELRELAPLMAAHRLVTIVGTGGVGKTRLGVEVARQRLASMPDGVWFVDLGSIRDLAAVPGAVVEAMGIRPASDEALADVLVRSVHTLRTLLLLDNCEHVVDGVATLVERLLEAGPDLRVLATSREPLHIPGEVVWQVPPIDTPAHPAYLDASTLREYDAVRLFVQRSAGWLALESLGRAELRTIGQITARLEGLPLAIELAAARGPVLGLDELARGLQQRIDLNLGSRTTRDRHRTLQATFDWSYRLLEPDLQAALCRLSVFVGWFTVEAAAAVVQPDARSVGDVVPVVAVLADRSLLLAGAPSGGAGSGVGPLRYRMLETIRQFAARQLVDEQGDEVRSGLQLSHAQYYSGLTRGAERALVGMYQGQRLADLELDHPNIAAAIARLLDEPGRAGQAAAMVLSLSRFWQYRGRLAECMSLLARAMDLLGPGADPGLRARASTQAGKVLIWRDSVEADRRLREALQLARETGSDRVLASAQAALAINALYTSNPELGRSFGMAAIELARSLGDPITLGECLAQVGGAVCTSVEAEIELHREAVDVTSRSGDRLMLALAHLNWANGLLRYDQVGPAREHLERAQTVYAELGVATPLALVMLGWVHLQAGEIALAMETFGKLIETSRTAHMRNMAACGLLGLACTASAARDWERAASLLAFADRELEDCGQAWDEPERRYRQAALDEVGRNLGGRAKTLYDSAQTADRDLQFEVALGFRADPRPSRVRASV